MYMNKLLYLPANLIEDETAMKLIHYFHLTLSKSKNNFLQLIHQFHLTASKSEKHFLLDLDYMYKFGHISDWFDSLVITYLTNSSIILYAINKSVMAFIYATSFILGPI